jgi:hypothetical protein
MRCLSTRAGRNPVLRSGLLLLTGGLFAGACTFDPDDRCDAHQEAYGDGERCVCEEGTAFTESGCVPCGEHEEPGSNGCVCVSGYTRPSEDAACEPAPEALGAACDADHPCGDATYSHCQPAADETGYCTTAGCTSSADCSGGYACDTSTAPTVCKRPPTGLGKSCAGAADCAEGEATFCDTFQTHQCLVQNCSLSPNDCFVGWTCTDLSSLGLPVTLCVPEGSL